MPRRPLLASHALCGILFTAACGGSTPDAPPPLPSVATPAVDAASPALSVPAPSPVAPASEPVRDPRPARADAKPQPADDERPASDKRPTTSDDKDRGLSLYELARRGEAQLPASAKPQAASPAPAPAPVKPAPAPAPVKPAAPAPAKPRTAVVVPSTARVHIDVPSALQATLDKDPRMQPWLNKVVDVIDGCFAKQQANNAGVRGTIEVTVTMHENERPDADVRALPPALSGMVACATGALMRTKMPLFTGPEGQRHNVKLRFGE